MNDEIVFQYADIRLTQQYLEHGSGPERLAVRDIKSVVFFKEPFDVKGFIINIIGAIIGVVGILTFKSICGIVGLIAIGVCGFNLYTFYNEAKDPTWIVAIDRYSGESVYIKRKGGSDWARKLYEALHMLITG